MAAIEYNLRFISAKCYSPQRMSVKVASVSRYKYLQSGKFVDTHSQAA
jgi:hypothetical protein